MARTFRRHRQSAPIAELNLTNLIDLGFTLLIIFMIATPLINQEQTIPVNLPVESRSTQQPPNPQIVFQTVTVRADGTFTLGTRQIDRAQLAREFAVFGAQENPPVFRIRVDANATAQHYIIVYDELKKAGLTKISMDTQVVR